MLGGKSMQVGVPKETKDQELRVGLTPASARALVEQGHSVWVETGSGVGAGFSDRHYTEAGAHIAPNADKAWAQDLILKVKEPQPQEFGYLRSGLLLFTYLHLAASRTLTEQLLASGTTAIAYETVETSDRRFPLLTPMSAIAGRLAVQFGAHYLERPQGGRGVLLGGVPGVPPGRVVILGGGIVGTEAARMAVGLGAQVTILDVNVRRLEELEGLFGSRVELLYSQSADIEARVRAADLVIGAVLIPGKRPPTLVGRSLVEQMQPGSVIVDVAVDQGGCIETLRPTSHSDPVYEVAGVLHYGVPNMPGAVPRTATQALNNSTLPYILQLAQFGPDAWQQNSALGAGVNIHRQKIVHPAIQSVFPDLPRRDLA
jgi:alanine dehydrogenase